MQLERTLLVKVVLKPILLGSELLEQFLLPCQGSLTKGESSVQLTSLYKLV
jgi:hypothetical protein